MADPNFIIPGHDDPYYDELMNIVNDPNPSLPLDSPLVPQSCQKSKDAIAMDIEDLEFWDLQNETDLQYSPMNPLGINGETSNQIETDLGNESLNNPKKIPALEDIATQEPFSSPCLIPPFTEERGEAIDDALPKTIISGVNHNESNGEASNQRNPNLGKQGLDNLNSRQLLQVQFGCSYCEILREIVHIEGAFHVIFLASTKIHGRLVGVFFHAILDVEQSSKAVSHEMFDFYEKGFEEVKQFLIQYCIQRKQEGCTMMKDPRSTFFEALCVGFDWHENLPDDGNFIDKTLSPDHPGDIQMDDATANNGNNQEKPPLSLAEQVVGATSSKEAANSNNNEKSPISLTEQRKRVKDMTFKDLANYFHLPRKEAAQQLGLSETVVHNIWCKSNSDGAKRRWPYRKVHSLEKEISKLRALLNSDDPQEKVRARNEIQRKEQEMAEIYKER